MKILILGAGKMGSFFTDVLSFDHECAVYEVDPKRMRFLYNTQRFTRLEEIDEFRPDLVINAVTLKYTISVFKEVIPHLHKDCIISDISSVKTGFKEFYESTGMHYVSTHPMFGPTFANLRELSQNHAVIISEGDHLGRVFFKDLYGNLGLQLHEFSFEEHDEMMTYSLSIPFVSTMVFAACMKNPSAPGTTFAKHLAIAKGVLSEDDYLVSEVLFSPYTPEKVENVVTQMEDLLEIIKRRDSAEMSKYLNRLRQNIKENS